MDTNLKEFKEGIKDFRKHVENMLAEATVISTSYIFKAVNLYSPSPEGELGLLDSQFSTGTFIASNRIGIGHQDKSIASGDSLYANDNYKSMEEKDYHKSGRDADINAEHAKQIAKLDKITGKENVYITNNTPYAKFIEHLGWHGQEGTWKFSSHQPYAPFRNGFTHGVDESKKKIKDLENKPSQAKSSEFIYLDDLLDDMPF